MWKPHQVLLAQQRDRQVVLDTLTMMQALARGRKVGLSWHAHITYRPILTNTL